MGIYVKGKKVDKIYYQNRPVIYVYTKGRKIWPEGLGIVLSCYYNGYWIDEYPWVDDTSWAD